jgi:hypothetical protein
MKIKTVLVASIAAGVGYVLGTKAGRSRFEEIRSRTKEFVESPKVQETVSNLSETVKQNAQKLPDPVANVVSAVADRAKGSTPETGSGAESTSGTESSDTETMYETGAPSATETTFGTTSSTGTTFGTQPTSPTEPKSPQGL